MILGHFHWNNCIFTNFQSNYQKKYVANHQDQQYEAHSFILSVSQRYNTNWVASRPPQSTMTEGNRRNVLDRLPQTVSLYGMRVELEYHFSWSGVSIWAYSSVTRKELCISEIHVQKLSFLGQSFLDHSTNFSQFKSNLHLGFHSNLSPLITELASIQCHSFLLVFSCALLFCMSLINCGYPVSAFESLRTYSISWWALLGL